MASERKVKEEPPADDDAEDEKGAAVVMNTISEYCRGLGDIPTYGLAGNRDDIDPSDIYLNDDMGEDSNPTVSLDDLPRKSKSGKWIEAEFDEQDRLSTVSSSDASEVSCESRKKTNVFLVLNIYSLGLRLKATDFRRRA